MKGGVALGGLALLSLGIAAPSEWTPKPRTSSEPTALVADGPDYDGRFNFVRIRWEGGGGGLRGGFGRSSGGPVCSGRGEPLWAHDMCRGAENYFATILEELTFVDPVPQGKTMTLDDPELFRYPIAYIVEVGSWVPSQAEANGLRNYLLKGGFLIVDDFRGPQELLNFEFAMNQLLPGVLFFDVEAGHRIWDVFFHISDPLALAPPTYTEHVPRYLGIFENNDPTGRLMVIMNLNNDIGEYWEWSGDGFIPIPLTNEAFKYGVNYVIYAMTN